MNIYIHVHTHTRYWTPKIAKCVNDMVDAKETLAEERQHLATYMLRDFDTNYSVWNAAVLATATLDCLMSLSYTANSVGDGAVCRPVLVKDAAEFGGKNNLIGAKDGSFLRLKQSRHPCIK
jgi:DNA mismatch repair ATPase MutS